MDEFEACEKLEFDQSKYNAKLVRISRHLGWERIDPDGILQLCQFCSMIGRLNSPEACIGKERAICSDYKGKVFKIDM